MIDIITDKCFDSLSGYMGATYMTLVIAIAMIYAGYLIEYKKKKIKDIWGRIIIIAGISFIFIVAVKVSGEYGIIPFSIVTGIPILIAVVIFTLEKVKNNILPDLIEFKKLLENFSRIINDSYTDSIRSVMLKLNNAHNPDILDVINNNYWNIRKFFDNNQVTSVGLLNSAIDNFNSLLSDFQQKIIKDFAENRLPLNTNPSQDFSKNYTALKQRYNDYFIGYEKFIKSIGKDLYSGIIFLP